MAITARYNNQKRLIITGALYQITVYNSNVAGAVNWCQEKFGIARWVNTLRIQDLSEWKSTNDRWISIQNQFVFVNQEDYMEFVLTWE